MRKRTTAITSSSYWPIVILLVAGTVSYLGSFSGALVFDDYTAIVGNPTIRQLSPITEVLSPPASTPMSARPVANLTLAINYAIHELDVWGYHALNLALHLLAGLTLFGILARTLSLGLLEASVAGRERSLATAIALIWLVHPLLTDSVVYITQRTELLMGLFYLLTMYCSIRARASPRRRLWEAAAIVFCALGMGSKEVMVSAPLMVVLYDRVFGRETWREQLRRRWGLYAGLAATWALLAVLMISSPRSGAGFGHGISAWDYVRTQAGVILHYLRLAVWPAPLVVSYADWPVVRAWSDWVLQTAAIGTLLGATLWTLQRRHWLGLVGSWFFLILAPTSSFVPIVTEMAAERRMYLPLISVIVLVVVGAWRVMDATRRLSWRPVTRRASAAVMVIALTMALGYATSVRARDFHSAIALWSDTVQKRPRNAHAYNGLGTELGMAGRNEEACAAYQAALELDPRHPEARANLGKVLAKLRRHEEAVVAYRRALETDPANLKVRHSLAVSLEAIGELDAAIQGYRTVLGVHPDHVLAQLGLGVCLQKQGKLSEAVEAYRQVLRLDPGHTLARANLARCLERLGRPD